MLGGGRLGAGERKERGKREKEEGKGQEGEKEQRYERKERTNEQSKKKLRIMNSSMKSRYYFKYMIE